MRTLKGSIFFSIFLLSLSLGLGFSLFLYWQVEDMLASEMISESKSSLQMLNEKIKVDIDHQFDQIRFLSMTEDFVTQNKKHSQQLLNLFLTQDNVFTSIHVYSKSGKLQFVSKRPGIPPYKIVPNFNLQKNKEAVDFLNRVINSGKAEFSVPYSTAQQRGIYYLYAVPLKNTKGRVYGVLSTAIFPSLHTFHKLTKGLGLKKNNIFILSDVKGKILSSSQNPQNPSPSEIWERQFPYSKNKSFFKWPGRKSLEEYTFLSNKIPSLGLVSTIGLHSSYLDEKILQLNRALYIFFSLTLIVSLFFAQYLSKRLSKPLTLLQSELEQINSGLHTNDPKAVPRVTQEWRGVFDQIKRLKANLHKHKILANLWQGEDSKRSPLERREDNLD